MAGRAAATRQPAARRAEGQKRSRQDDLAEGPTGPRKRQRKAQAAGAADSAAKFPPGPTSRQGVLKSLEHYLSSMPADEVQALKTKVSFGIAMTTDYSGTGQPEHVLLRLAEWVGTQGLSPSVQRLRCSDIAEHCRRVLTAFPSDNSNKSAAAPCVLGDITQRLPDKLRRDLECLILQRKASRAKELESSGGALLKADKIQINQKHGKRFLEEAHRGN